MREEQITSTAVEDEPARWDPPTHTLGSSRYQIGRQIGEGAMGVVHEAYDPSLDRNLAVKLLIPGRDTDRGRRRLLREAQAMARLSHPNVVAVHDVGEEAGQVFMVMDHVSGPTLTQWIAREPRGWRAIVDMFIQAGRGLAAAHRAGFVHRDFKPENVLIDEEGVARVMDFGLVRAVEDSAFDDPDDEGTRAGGDIHGEGGDPGASGSLGDGLTKTGAVLGTPAYMAPEQATGGAADERSDQFSFCVALFEGLYGHRPFEGETAEDLLASADSERIKAPRRGDVPSRIHAAVLRGLRRRPSLRWPSMDALLKELGRRSLRIPVRTAAGVTAGMAVLGLVAANIDWIRAWWNPVSVTMTAEAGETTAPMAVVKAGDRDAYAASGVANQGRIEWTFTVPTAGRYYLRGLVWEERLGGDRGDADSFFVYVDDGEEVLWHFGCQNEVFPEHVLVDHWAWQPVWAMRNADSDCEIDSDLGWDLEAGSHTLVVRNREDAASPAQAARLAKLVITNQPDWRP